MAKALSVAYSHSALLVFFVCLVSSQENPKDKPPCQGEFYEPTGEVESPEYPNNYPDESNCIYRILTNKIVNITFSRFSLENSEDCRYDYLQFVFEAGKKNSRPQRFCGDGLDKINNGNIRGPGPLIIGFVSDEADNMRGYKFTFEFELNGPDPCLSEPCQQGGECTRYIGYYLCSCPDGYAGVNCEIDKDECASYPCENGGICEDGINSFTCQCINDYGGDFCNIKPERCSPDPCDNGGLCVDRGRDFVCSCPKDFMGDRCEKPIPTPPPPETPATTTVAPTEPMEEKEDVPTESEGSEIPTSDVINEEPQDKQMENTAEDVETTNAPSQENDNNPNNPSNSSNLSTPVIILVIFLLLILLLLAALLWRGWRYHRKKEKEKLRREVTLVNMKTKSEHGQGKTGKKLTRTTSINSITMKGSPGKREHLLNHLKKMSEDIIMEEITDTSLEKDSPSNSKDSFNKTEANFNSFNDPFCNQYQQQPDHLNKKKIVAANNGSLPRHKSIPIAQGELIKMINNHDPHVNKENPFQSAYKLTPDAAVNLLNILKQNKGTNFDYQSALQRYGVPSYHNKPYPNGDFKRSIIANAQQAQHPHPVNQLFHSPAEQSDKYQLPHVPLSSHPEIHRQQNSFFNQSYEPNADSMNDELELNPTEAADLINHFLVSEPATRGYVSSAEAMDVMRRVKSRTRTRVNQIPAFDREKTVVIKPQEIAQLMNNIRNHSRDQNNDPIQANEESNYFLPSENEIRQPLRVSRDFREYTPIREESDPNDEDRYPHQENQNKRNIGTKAEKDQTRPRITTKNFPYARTLDPDEKVHDWLESTPKHKRHKCINPPSPDASSTTATHTVTRIFPQKMDDEAKNAKAASDYNDANQNNIIPKTIKQTRRISPEKQHILPVTENKAKSLVEKLVKAPARSNKNVVGPGLEVAREKAFVGEHNKFDTF